MGDKEVVLKIRNGEIDCFEILVKKYSDIIYRYLFSKLKKREDCEDLLQEIFLSFYKSLMRFDEKKPILPYLFKITKNSLKMFYRKRKIVIPLKEETIKENDYFESLEKIDFNLNKLNKKEKLIFKMLGQGYKIKEIAEKLKIKDNTVKSMIRRGRMKLKII
jgi:RNA polymerase sigma-70 factor (ECF subfamily)